MGTFNGIERTFSFLKVAVWVGVWSLSKEESPTSLRRTSTVARVICVCAFLPFPPPQGSSYVEISTVVVDRLCVSLPPFAAYLFAVTYIYVVYNAHALLRMELPLTMV